MIVVEYHNVELDYCQQCHGSWFDQGELDLLFKSMQLESSFSLLDRLVHQPQAQTQEKKYKCPICHKRMQKHFVGHGLEVLVDVCSEEHGIWLDSDEVHALVAYLGKNSSPEYDSEQELVAFLGEVFESEEDKNNK